MSVLKLVPPKQAAVNKSVVEVLKEMLAGAKRGEIQAIAFAVVWEDGALGNGWSSHYDRERMWHAAVGLEADLRDER